MICLSRGIGSGSLADLLFLTWPWYCSTSRRCGCLRTPSLKKKKTKQKEKNIFCARVVRSQVVADFFCQQNVFKKLRDAEMFFPTRWAPVPRTVALSKKKKKEEIKKNKKVLFISESKNAG